MEGGAFGEMPSSLPSLSPRYEMSPAGAGASEQKERL